MSALSGKKRSRPKAKQSDAAKVVEQATLKYKRGPRNASKSDADKKLRAGIKAEEARYQDAAVSAASAEILLTEQAGYLEADGMERTYKYTQKEIAKHVNIQTAQKMFDLNLPDFGPYRVGFTRSGRHLALGGDAGHLAVMDTLRNTLACEINVAEKVRDITFLHDHTMIAVAQRKYVHIYDNAGTELHCLRHHVEPLQLDFLRYHFLLVTSGRTGFIKWQDTSTGQLVSEFRTKRGPSECMRHNPRNAVSLLGHTGGVVTMWSPSVSTPLVKMKCHRGSVTALAADLGGNYLVTTGADSQMKVWDLRTYKAVHEYLLSSPASDVDLSQLGAIGVGFGSHVQVWKDALRQKAKAPYMRHGVPGSQALCLRFKPFDDVLAVGHRTGLTNMVVPGSGEPNYDAFEANPYQTAKQKRESTVQSLLEKLQPSMITLDPTMIGKIDRAPEEVIERERAVAAQAAKDEAGPIKKKKKARGRNKAGRREKKKMHNIIIDEKTKRQEALARETKAASGKGQKKGGKAGGASKKTVQPNNEASKAPPAAGALNRFTRRLAKD